jgi:Acetyltransferase (GNAT) family
LRETTACLSATKSSEVRVEQLREKDLGEADRIFRVAFGTFTGLSDPSQMFGDRQIIVNRWRMNPAGVIGAYLDGLLVGSNVVTKWGKFGIFGPLSVRPEMWDMGIAQRLLKRTMEMFSGWQTTQEGLFTFAQSPKHVGLYQKFGFHARFLTAIMEKKAQVQGPEREERLDFDTFSGLVGSEDREGTLKECQELTGGIYPGLDLSDEINMVHDLKLGDTILVREDSRITGLAICHFGAGTEAGSGRCFIKFGAAASGPGAETRFRDILDACETLASRNGVGTIEGGVNLGRPEAYREMLSRGFRTQFLGVAMQRPNKPGFNRPDVFAIDDWR